MTGSVASPKASLSLWLEKVDKQGAKDTEHLRGNAKALHIRTGFEKFTEGVQKLFMKKTPELQESGKSRVFEAIKNDFGAEIATKVFARYQDKASITVGDLRSMMAAAKFEVIPENLQQSQAKLEDRINQHEPLTKSLSPNVNLGETVNSWGGQGTLAQTVLEGAGRHVTDDLSGINRFMNNAVTVNEAGGTGGTQAIQRGLELAEMMKTYEGTPALETMQGFSSLAISSQLLTKVGTEKSAHPSQTNNEVLSRNFAQFRNADPQLAKLHIDFGSVGIIGTQLAPRFELFERELHAHVEKFNKLASNPETKQEDLDKQRRMIENTAKEIVAKVSEGIKNFKDAAMIFQDPRMQDGLSEDASRVLTKFADDYGRTAAALSDPRGPAQNLVAFALLCTADPQAGHALLHP